MRELTADLVVQMGLQESGFVFERGQSLPAEDFVFEGQSRNVIAADRQRNRLHVFGKIAAIGNALHDGVGE